jgi:hypothetical protein
MLNIDLNSNIKFKTGYFLKYSIATIFTLTLALVTFIASVSYASSQEGGQTKQMVNIDLEPPQEKGDPLLSEISTQTTLDVPCSTVPTLQTQLGVLSTVCQLTGPTFNSTTQQVSAYTPHNPNLIVPPYGFPSGQPYPPAGNNVTNHHASYNSACNLNTEGVPNSDPNIGNNRKICPGSSRIVGTDLGVPVEFQNKLYLLFGDTSNHDATPSAELSNIIVATAPLPINPNSCLTLTENRTTDGVVREGINRATFQNFMQTFRGTIESICGPVGAFRAIPIAALTLNVGGVSKIYVWYMGTTQMGACGLAGTNFIGLATSTNGINFNPVSGATWGPEPYVNGTDPNTLSNRPRFLLGALQANGYVYTYWTKAYRQNYVYIARVLPSNATDPYAYEFLVQTPNGDVWERSPSKLHPNAKNIFGTPAQGDHRVTEFSIQYNSYIGGYVAGYFGVGGPGSPERPLENSGYYLRTGKDPWGPFALQHAFKLTNPYEAQWRRKKGSNCFDQSFNGNYGMYLHPRLMNGQDLYFIISSWGHYNTFLMKLTLDSGMQNFFGTGSYPIRLFASGEPSSGVYPHMQLVVGGDIVKAWYVTDQLAEYIYYHPKPVPMGQIQVRFTNDACCTNGDRNLRVDRLQLGGAVLQTESSTTRSTGTFTSDNGCGPGYKQSEWLHCNGEFQFNQ